jgi:Uma2 family endonuclease
MAIQSRPLTYADLQQARDTNDERLELIEGEIVVTPSPAPMHQLVAHRLAVLLDHAIVATDRGIVMQAPVDVFLEEHNVPQPDLVVLLNDRLHLFGSTMIESAPSMVIEIISPSSGDRDRVTKRNLYARFGVPEYWLVDPDGRSIAIFSHPREGRYQAETVASDVADSATIPGLAIEVAALFASVSGG